MGRALGLAPRYVDPVFEKILELKGAGVSMLIVEQNAARALEMVDWGYVLELGRNRFENAGGALLADDTPLWRTRGETCYHREPNEGA